MYKYFASQGHKSKCLMIRAKGHPGKAPYCFVKSTCAPVDCLPWFPRNTCLWPGQATDQRPCSWNTRYWKSGSSCFGQHCHQHCPWPMHSLFIIRKLEGVSKMGLDLQDLPVCSANVLNCPTVWAPISASPSFGLISKVSLNHLMVLSPFAFLAGTFSLCLATYPNLGSDNFGMQSTRPVLNKALAFPLWKP